VRRLIGTAAIVLAALLHPAAGAASPNLKLGVMDQALFANRPDLAWNLERQLRPQVLRFELDWSAVAPRRPLWPYDPEDPAYRFGALDRLVQQALERDVYVVLTIVRTPAWAGGGADGRRAPRDLQDLRAFAYAAAFHYGRAVQRWTAWNEPNLTQTLIPQVQMIDGRLTMVSPRIYAGILTAIYQGVHQAGTELGIREQVAGGVTAPFGCGLHCRRHSIAPLTFLRQVAAFHPPFDVWAHHPYRVHRDETPTRGATDPQVSFGNLGDLRTALDRLYPGRHVPIWITEIGYQTNPPDHDQGVSPREQARYLAEVVRRARQMPGVELLVWFMLRDESIDGRANFGGFQTGLVDDHNRRKPAFWTFRSLALGGS